MTQDQELHPEIGYQLYGCAEDAAEGRSAQLGLLDHLRFAGLPIGPREHLAAGTLLSRLLTELPNREPAWTLADFRADLAPLLARTPEETATFTRVFDSLAPQWRAAAQPSSYAYGPVDDSGQGGVAGRTKPPLRPPLLATFAAAAVIVAAGLVWLWPILFPPPPTEAPVEVTPPPVVVEPPTPVPEPDPDKVVPDTDALPVMDRLREVAGGFAFAPSLHELAGKLAAGAEVGWSAEAYALRLQELTGLPTDRPLDLSGVGPSANTLASLAVAVDLIERPGRGAGIEEYLAAASASSAPDTSARALRDLLNTRVAQPLPDAREDALARITEVLSGEPTLAVDPAAIERALAIEPDPRLTWRTPTPPGSPASTATSPPWWALVLAVLTPLLLCAAWLANALVFKRAFLRRRRPEFPPLLLDLRAKARSTVGFAADAFREAARKLARRTPKITDRLDIEKTIQSTLRGGGVLVEPAFATSRNAPEYLVLIERRAPGDHDYERLRQMAHRLKDVLPVIIYAYQSEPAFLEPEDDGRPETLDRLAAKYPDHRLIVLGSGAGFLNVRKLTPTPAAEKLMRWERRALLTPLPVAEWAQDEFQLARALNMPIGRATPEGFAVLAELLGLDGAAETDLVRPTGDNLAQPLPAILRLDPEDLLYPHPPEDRPISAILAHLRTYLDPAGFDWLCALAVYPAIQWDLTLFLGTQLPRLPGGDPIEDPAYSEDRIAAIALLPWFREGHMPNWLRKALIEAMGPERQKHVHGLIGGLLKDATLPHAKTEEEVVRFKLLREQMEERRKNEPQVGPPPEFLMEDQVLIDFLAKGDVTDFEFVGPEESRPTEKKLTFRWIEACGIAVAAAYAGAAFFAAPKPWDGPVPTGAWIGLGVLGLGGLLGMALLLWRHSYEAARMGLERAVSVALTVAVLLVVFPGLQTASGQSLLAPLILAGLLLTPLSRLIARQSGVYYPSARARLAPRVLSMAVEGLAAGLIAALAFAALLPPGQVINSVAQTGLLWPGLGPEAVPLLVAAGIGVGLAALGLLAARLAPEKLPPPKHKVMFGTPGAWRSPVLAAGLMLLTGAPAVLFAGWFEHAHVRLEAPEAPGAQTLAVSPDGALFAVAGVDGTLATFAADAPQTPLTRISLGSRAPVVALAIRQVPAGPAFVAAMQADGRFAVHDARGGASVFTAEIPFQGLRPQVAIGPDGQWAYAMPQGTGAVLVTGPAGESAMELALPVLALTAAEDGPGRWIAALADGQLALVAASGVSLAEPQTRPLGRARTLTVQGTIARAVGEDGSILEAEITPAGLVNARLLPADPRRALGNAIGWQQTERAEPDMAACTELAEQIQALSQARTLNRIEELQADFTWSCPGLTVEELAGDVLPEPPDQAVCEGFARTWAGIAEASRAARRDRLLQELPAQCEALRQEITAWQPAVTPRQQQAPSITPLPDLSGATQVFVVYFDFDRSDLTPEARAVLDQALQKTPANTLSRVVAVGHTDTSNSAAYALALSTRMAGSVRAYLTAQGVRGDRIETIGLGETRLARPTADGVREPLNRRVEVHVFADQPPPQPVAFVDARTTPASTRAPVISVNPASLPDFALFRECEDCPEMVVIPAGTFLMGSPSTEAGRGSDEGPQRSVSVGRFAVGRFETTWAEWEVCVAAGRCDNGPVTSAGGDNGWGKGRRPVIEVSWNDARAYAGYVSGQTRGAYRLPSEAEWEYAARGGTSTRWSFGEAEGQLGTYAWFSSNSSYRTQPVGGRTANPWGLFDVHGNVWEWVEDCFASYAGAPTNGTAVTTSDCSFRVLRGGSWSFAPRDLRSASRSWDGPAVRSSSVGFRLARTL